MSPENNEASFQDDYLILSPHFLLLQHPNLLCCSSTNRLSSVEMTLSRTELSHKGQNALLSHLHYGPHRQDCLQSDLGVTEALQPQSRVWLSNAGKDLPKQKDAQLSPV